MNIVRISTKGQIVIPSKLRKLLSIKVGDQFTLKRDANQIVLSPLKYSNLDELFNVFKAKSFISKKEIKNLSRAKATSKFEHK